MLLFSLLLGMDHVANEINLADALPARIAFEEALLFMKSKIPLTKEEYYALEAKLRFRAFTVGRLTQMDAIEIVRKKLNEVISEGRTIAQFFQEAGADRLLQSAGFHDSNPWYWNTVYQNNIMGSYNTGRALEIQETKPDMLEFIGIDDRRQSEICRARTGTIRRRDDPWWNGNYPILHHGCRSTVRAIFAEEAKIRGIKQTKLKSYYPPPQPGFGGNPLDTGSFYQLTPGMKERAKQYGILGEIAKAGHRLGIG